MDNNGEVVYLYLDDIIPNRFQPREVFDDQALKELAVSIREHGVIQPIIVRKVENKYEIIAGERRYKASTMAGLTKIPAIVKNLDDKESSKVALIENLQRKDLSPIEEARTYQKILELENGMTQEQLAATLGKTQSSVSNKLRLLDLPEEIQDALLKEKLSERHARSILSIEDKNDQIKMMDKVIAEKMTVRELDKEIKILKGEAPEIEALDGPESKNQNDAPVIPTLSIGDSNEIVSTVPESTPVVEQAIAEIPTITPSLNIGDNNMDNQSSSTENQPVVATFNSNPTSVDIDKIRENSTDISPIGQQPTAEVKDSTANPETSQEEFKFVPTLEANGDSAPSIIEATTAPEFNQLFNTNVTNTTDTTDNNSIASAIPSMEIAVPSVTPSKDITPAVNDIKTAITNLQNNGYSVTFEEQDETNDYKISIQINKN